MKTFCILVDIGGEDTKISTIALAESELFNNAMEHQMLCGYGKFDGYAVCLVWRPARKMPVWQRCARPRRLRLTQLAQYS